MIKFLKRFNWYWILLLFFVFLVCLCLVKLLRTIEPFTNDDAFVYYNYARNITEGRFFAYDMRNIPSEGFTSLIYLLLLIPFEFFKVNMTFASMVINLAAMTGSILVMYRLVRFNNFLTKGSSLLLISGIMFVLISDTNVITSLNWGLETMLGPLVVFLAALALAKAIQTVDSDKAINIFFILLFLAYLIRPESMAFIFVCGFPILIIQKTTRKQVVKKLIVFCLVFAIYHLLKYLVFSDIFPTGYYRKISGGSGLGYVLNWLKDYAKWLIGLAVATGLSIAYAIKHKGNSLTSNKWVLFLVGVGLLNILFCTQTQPLVGMGYRFLMTPIFILYLILGFLFVWFIEQTIPSNVIHKSLLFLLMFVLFVFSAKGFRSTLINPQLRQQLNIYSKAIESTANHKYIQLGSFLHQKIPHSADITLVYGDAGVIPYTFDGIFIDTNGLTEPKIAHLFQLPDGSEKTQAYISYILSQNPDIVFFYLPGMDENGLVTTSMNQHSPFTGATPIEVYQAYKSFGVEYCCSLSLYYDVHIGIRTDSPYINELSKAFLDYSKVDGYILPQGFTVTDNNDQVQFPNGLCSP